MKEKKIIICTFLETIHTRTISNIPLLILSCGKGKYCGQYLRRILLIQYKI